MNAIIRLGNGKYYCSAVFGYYDDNKTDNYSYDMYYIVFNQEKTKLIKQPLFNPKSYPQLDKTVLIIDGDQTNWTVSKNGYGGVDFLPKEDALHIIESGIMPGDLLNKCLSLGISVNFEDYQEIRDSKDVDNLMWVSGGFHDAVISKQEEKQDDSLSVLFYGIWGYSIELIFSGNVSYCTDSRNPNKYDPYWFGSTLILKDGYKIFIDDYDVDIEDVNNNYCWFKAKTMKYRVIPE